MQKMTRRAAFMAIPAIGATAVVAPVAKAATPADSYAAFIASLGDRISEGDRVQIFGGVQHVRAEIMRTSIEQVHPKVSMPVEHIVASYRLTERGWQSEGYY